MSLMFLIATMFGRRFFVRFLVLFLIYCAVAFYAVTR
jgi:hypothetical protein